MLVRPSKPTRLAAGLGEKVPPGHTVRPFSPGPDVGSPAPLYERTRLSLFGCGSILGRAVPGCQGSFELLELRLTRFRFEAIPV